MPRINNILNNINIMPQSKLSRQWKELHLTEKNLKSSFDCTGWSIAVLPENNQLIVLLTVNFRLKLARGKLHN